MNDLDAIDSGKPNIEDDHIGVSFGGDAECFFARRSLFDIEVARPKVCCEGSADLRFVVNDENGGHGAGIVRVSIAESPTGDGREMIAVSPPPGVSSSRIVPFIASMKPRATASPKPVPALPA